MRKLIKAASVAITSEEDSPASASIAWLRPRMPATNLKAVNRILTIIPTQEVWTPLANLSSKPVTGFLALDVRHLSDIPRFARRLRLRLFADCRRLPINL